MQQGMRPLQERIVGMKPFVRLSFGKPHGTALEPRPDKNAEDES